MTTDVDVFLEHHGVKGQKWGRRNYERGQKKSKYFVSMTPAEREKFHNSPVGRKARQDTKVFVGKIGASIGVGIVAGTFVGKLVRKRADLPVAKIAAGVTSYAGTALTLHLLDANGKRKVRSLNSKKGK